MNEKVIEMICSGDEEIMALGANILLKDYKNIEHLIYDLDNFTYGKEYYQYRRKVFVDKNQVGIPRYYYSYGIINKKSRWESDYKKVYFFNDLRDNSIKFDIMTMKLD